MTSPVLAALRKVVAPTSFENWCGLKNLRTLPAPPALVAAFVDDCAPLGLDKVWPIVQGISRAHVAANLADPTLGGVVAAAINRLSEIKPPRAWPDADKARFLELPYDLQTYFAAHEQKREGAIRRAHNEAATARQELATIQKPAGADHGTQSHATA